MGIGHVMGITRKDIREATSQITPGVVQPAMDKWLLPKNASVIPAKTSLEGEYERQKPDWFSLWTTGRPSLRETDNRRMTREVKEWGKTDAEILDRAYDIVIDHILGEQKFGSDLATAQYWISVLEDNQDKVMEAINKKLQGQITSAKQKESIMEGIAGYRARARRESMER